MRYSRSVRTLAEALSQDLALSASTVGRSSFNNSPSRSVYTVFDGDDFYFTGAMARHVFASGRIPVSPEACLGYEHAVMALGTKSRVLKFDVALLAKADEVWIYSDHDPAAPSWASLAEGMLVEILWFLRRCGANGAPAPLFFVSLSRVVAGELVKPARVQVTYEEVAAALRNSHGELLQLMSEFERSRPPKVATCIFGLEMAKNAAWIRRWMLHERYAPIVPSLAFDSGRQSALEDLVRGWLWSVQAADVVYSFGSMNGHESLFASVLIDYCHTQGIEIAPGSWQRVSAPKAIHGKNWPISEYERREFQGARVRRGGILSALRSKEATA